MVDDKYLSLEKIAGQVNLPQRYIRKQAEAGRIPHLIVGGRLRFQLRVVRESLGKIEQASIKLKKAIIGGKT